MPVKDVSGTISPQLRLFSVVKGNYQLFSLRNHRGFPFLLTVLLQLLTRSLAHSRELRSVEKFLGHEAHGLLAWEPKELENGMGERNCMELHPGKTIKESRI